MVFGQQWSWNETFLDNSTCQCDHLIVVFVLITGFCWQFKIQCSSILMFGGHLSGVQWVTTPKWEDWPCDSNIIIIRPADPSNIDVAAVASHVFILSALIYFLLHSIITHQENTLLNLTIYTYTLFKVLLGFVCSCIISITRQCLKLCGLWSQHHATLHSAFLVSF